MKFEEWKSQALNYLHGLQNKYNLGDCDWMLGDDEDMKRDGFSEGDSPEEYVDYQFECA